MHYVVKSLPALGLALAVLFPGGGCKPQAAPPEGASALRAKVARGVKQSQGATAQIEAALRRSDPKAVRKALQGASQGLTLVRSGFPKGKSAGPQGKPQGVQGTQGVAAKLHAAQRGIDWMTRGMNAMRTALDGWNQDPHAAHRRIRRGLRVFKRGLTTLQGTTKSQKKSPCGCKSDGECQDKGGGAAGSCGGGAPPNNEAASTVPENRSPRRAKGGCGCGGRKASRPTSGDQCL